MPLRQLLSLLLLATLLSGTALSTTATAAAPSDYWERQRWIRDSLHQPPAEQQRRLPALIALLADANLDLSTSAADVIGRLGIDAKAAIPALIHRLGEPNGEAGAIYSGALAHLGEPARRPLYQAVLSADRLVRSRACDALHRLQPDHFGAECRYSPSAANGLTAVPPLIDTALTHAQALLERYGDTFYALGYYRDWDGRRHSLSPTTDALTPSAIAADLLQQLAGKSRDAEQTLLLTDYPEQQLLQLRFTRQGGNCTTWLLGYRFDPQGQLHYSDRIASRCRTEVSAP